MVVAYWTDWTSAAMPPEAIPFEKVTHVNYAFSIVTSDFRPVFETGHLLNRVVAAAHAKNVKVLMSIGGWTGSQHFSPLAATEYGRRTFIDGAVKMVKDYNLDGIDIDWEYPGRPKSACNIFDEQNDAKNFLVLLQELRATLDALPNGNKLEISLATRIPPFDGPNGLPTDVSEFSKVVNHINIMAYDMNGSWSALTGANAPLTGADGLSYVGGAQAWIDAGVPPQQINMGVPFYGRSVITNTDMSTTLSMAAPFRKSVPPDDSNDGLWADPCEGTAAFSVIEANGQARAPWIRKFDEASQTPWLFNPHTNQFISYDDQESLRLKVEYAKRKNLALGS
ncbi:MAG: glycoside hydrolase superfamily [Benniella sp.]|nr:MAG: glycoside hydrolase superfamily [Benniella sp.]